MNNTEIIITVRQHELDGSYSEWTTKPGLFAFSAKMKREIKKLLGAKS
jgi:hypothetical protein